MKNNDLQGRILGGLWGPGPPGVTKGAPKRRKKERKGKREGRKEGKRGKEGNKKEKGKKKGARKKKERKKVKSIWWEGRHAVSNASRGSMEENVRGAKLTEKRTRGAPCSFKCKQGLQGRKRQGRQIDGEKEYRGTMQFQVKVGASGKKTSGAPNWRRKGRKGRHAVSSASRGSRKKKRQGRQIDGAKDERGAMQCQVQAGVPGKKMSVAPNWRSKGWEGRYAVSSASRGSREENVRGAKLTEQRTRGALCSFKCKQAFQGRKCQWRQIDGKKDERCAMQFQVQAGAPGKKTSGAPNWRRKGREGRHAVSRKK